MRKCEVNIDYDAMSDCRKCQRVTLRHLRQFLRLDIEMKIGLSRAFFEKMDANLHLVTLKRHLVQNLLILGEKFVRFEAEAISA